MTGTKLGHPMVLERTILARKEAVRQGLEACVATLRGNITAEMLRHLTVAIDEALQNAYEHGCLEISNLEKAAALEGECFQALLFDREQLAANARKRISFRLELTGSECVVKIVDPGPGFDWRQALRNATLDQTSDAPLGHGLRLIVGIIDELTFNAKGNEITLRKLL